jgi:hypothetical protein
MTKDELSNRATNAQAPWGPIGIREGEDFNTILVKLALQIDALRDAINDLRRARSSKKSDN